MTNLTALKLTIVAGVVVYALLAQGCAALPNSVAPEFTHISHASQHFGANHTNYGANIANVTAEWDFGKHAYLTLSEGIDLDRHYRDINSYGDIIGPREQFTAKVGYKFVIKQ